MLVSEFMSEVNDNLRGIDDDAPVADSTEWQYWLRVANRIRRTLYRDLSKSWPATYTLAEIGTIAASTDPTFDLEEEYLGPANDAYVIDLEGHRRDFKIIKPQEKDYRQQEVFVAGADPQVLSFTKEIITGDAMIGGTLFLPAYFMPDDMANASDTVVVDDPDWLAMATASEIAFGDITYEDKAPDINNKANTLYKAMIQNNMRGTYGNARITPTRVQRIPGTGRRS